MALAGGAAVAFTATIPAPHLVSLATFDGHLTLRATHAGTGTRIVLDGRARPLAAQERWSGGPMAAATLRLDIATLTAGRHSLRLISAWGTGAVTPFVLITPGVTRLSVVKGSARGGTRLVVTGSGFTRATRVYLGGTPARVLSVTARQIVVLTPAHAAGKVALYAVNDGRSRALAFTYVR